jgi:hypothetical protein
MAFRELWSNCKDEGGTIEPQALTPTENTTTISVTGDMFFQEWRDRYKFLLMGEPVFSETQCGCRGLEMYEGRSEFLFYRGTRVGSLDRPSMYTYNIVQKIALTEDRTIQDPWWFQRNAPKAIGHLKDKTTLARIMTAPDEYAEHHFSWNQIRARELSDEFKEVLIDLMLHQYRSLPKLLLDTARSILEVEEYVQVPLSEYDQSVVEEAWRIVAAAGLGFERGDVRFVADLRDKTVHGMMNFKNNRIMVARHAIDLGAQYLAGVLLEELIHRELRYFDETRDFQNYIMDKWSRALAELLHLRGIPAVTKQEPASASVPVSHPSGIDDEIPF